MFIKKCVLISSLFLASCQGPGSLSSPDTSAAPNTSPSLHIATVSEHEGGRINVFIQAILPAIAQPTEQFGLKNNRDGGAAKTFADISAMRIFLIDENTTPSGGQVSPVQGVFNMPPAATSNVLFENVPTGKYKVCAAAFDNNATFNVATNIMAYNSNSHYAEGLVQCSTSGGDGGGAVTVGAAPNYTVDATPNLNIALTLRPASGAHLEVNATITDG